MKNIILIILLYPILGYSQIPVVQGFKMHVIDSVHIDYSQNPTEVFVRESNFRWFSIRRLTAEVVSPDTMTLNLFYLDCSSFFIGHIKNDTIIDVPQGLNSSFNLIVRTYKDTLSDSTYFSGNCMERDFYTLMDSVFIPNGDTVFSVLSVNDESMTDQDFLLYPNPVSTQLFVEFPNSINSLNYSIFNTQGKQLLTGKLEESIDVSLLKKGMYIIRFEGVNLNLTKTFIVK